MQQNPTQVFHDLCGLSHLKTPDLSGRYLFVDMFMKGLNGS